jgi:hypothetical protein
LQTAPALLVLYTQLVDRLTEIVTVGRVELPVAGEAHARRLLRREPARCAAGQETHQSGGAQWRGASPE